MRTIPLLLIAGVLAVPSAIIAAPPAPVAPAPSTQKGEPNTLGKLPQAHEYQQVLRKFMATLTEKDFTHGVTTLVTEKTTDTDPEYLYRHYIMTMMHQPLIGTKRGYPAINAPPARFTLAGIETAEAVMHPPVWPETLIPFVQWKHPGNPYYDNRALKLRAFVTAAVMLMMLDDAFENDPKLGRADRFSYQLVYFGLPYPGFKDVLPADVQKAYETGLKKMGERVLSWGIRGEDIHNDLHAPFGLHCVARAINDAAFTKTVEAYSRKLFTDPQYFSPAGYWIQRGGPDIPFNGHANFFAVTAALATDWPFAKESLDRVYRLRGHLILPEPDGKFSGPSHFNSRLGGAASLDQWAWDGARDTAAAMVTDEAAHVARRPTEEELREAPAKRARHFAEDIRENGVDGKGGFIKNEQIISYPWKWRVWMTYNFPASVNPGYEFYHKGAFAHRLELEKKNSPLLKSPFERGESFIRDFNKEFVVARQPNFAAILHTGPIGSQHANDGMRQFTGPMGLSGGQLSAFWTPGTGSVILGQRGSMNNDKSFDPVETWRTWPNHSVSGVTADGVFFTSARIQKPTTDIAIDGNTSSVKVAGTIPASIVGQEKTIAGKYDYSRTFKIDDKGVNVETRISGDGKEQLAELYEVLPIYLRDTKDQPKEPPTVIEFQVGDKWAPATDAFTENVKAVRLTRFKGSVVVSFEQPRRVKLSAADWADTYLSRGTARNVLIDLLENGDKPAALKDAKKVGYRLEAAAR
ncbi:MAG: hypothetical protein K8U57_29475 [Planctomycetes bacterium]|nr:hypothetical protein [Planctomycetota bacterium]